MRRIRFRGREVLVLPEFGAGESSSSRSRVGGKQEERLVDQLSRHALQVESDRFGVETKRSSNYSRRIICYRVSSERVLLFVPSNN